MTTEKVFRLEVNLRIAEYEKDNTGYERRTQNTLQVEDSLDLGSRDFMGLMRVLGEMHKAIKAIDTIGEGKEPVYSGNLIKVTLFEMLDQHLYGDVVKEFTIDITQGYHTEPLDLLSSQNAKYPHRYHLQITPMTLVKG